MIIGKLYGIPFTKQLIVASTKEDARSITNKPINYLSDIYHKDLEMVNGYLCLTKAYMGQKTIKCSKEVCTAWERLKSEV